MLPMSAPRKNSISEEQFMPQKLVTGQLLTAAKGSSATRQLPEAGGSSSRGGGAGRGGRGGRGRGGSGSGGGGARRQP